jgi:hypothetical protein
MKNASIPNPWTSLSFEPPYLLEQDAMYVHAFNCGHQIGDSVWINTNRLPEPRQGSIDARLWILQLNPSCQGSDPKPHEACEAIAALGDEKSLHLPINSENEWWKKRYRDLAKKVKGNSELAKRICSIEYFPYASEKFGHSHLRLPSQEYTFEILRNALRDKKVIVITRGLNVWIGAVPELKTHFGLTVFKTINPRSASITEKNLGKSVFEKVLAALNSEPTSSSATQPPSSHSTLTTP